MLYINNPKQLYKTYDEVVEATIKYGVDMKRVYIYLASMGVKSALARAMSSDGMDYLPAIKVAVRGKTVISSVTTCKSCKQLVIK